MQHRNTLVPPRQAGRRGSRRPSPLAPRFTALFAAAIICAAGARGQDAFGAGPPTAATPPTAVAAGWSAWTPAANQSFLSPSLSVNPVAGGLELAVVGLDLNVTCSHVSGSPAAPLTIGRQSFLPPVSLSEPDGTPHVLVTGIDGAITDSRFQNNAWSAPAPTGMLSFLPPASAVASDGSRIDLVAVGPDGGVRHSRFAAGAWSPPAALNAVTFLPPALAAGPGGVAELAIVGLDRQVYHAHFSGSQWGPFEPAAVATDDAPALAVSPDGVVHLAVTGLDRAIVSSRLQGGAWTAAIPTGAQSELSPAMVFNAGANTLELLARGLDRSVQHGQFTGSAWTAPVSLGITTDSRPALVADGKGGLDAAVTATDGRVYVSHFSGSMPLPTNTPATAGGPAPPSFSRDILRIFTNNGAKTCAQAGCHSGSRPAGNQNLEKANAYASIVNVASSEQPKLKRVLPGDAANSYLFQKVAAGLMPRTGGPLTAADVDLIRHWINAGAPNN